jgi:outer membrane protein TolC
MRWKSLCGGLALMLAIVASGCKQQCFVTESDLHTMHDGLPADLERKPPLSCQPTVGIGPEPMTLDHLDRKIRYVSLAECIAIALEQGTIAPVAGQVFGLLVGVPNVFPLAETLPAFTGRGITTNGNDSVRILALDPARAGAEIEGALAKFDAHFVGSINWNTTDQPIGTSLQTFQAGQSGLNFIEQEQATGSAQLLKPLPTGGVAGITFNLPYTFTNLPARVNPAYQPALQFQFEQPLLQGFGVEINQLRASHPGSILNPGVLQTTTTQEGILISRVRFDEQRIEFERNIHALLLNVEAAYWNLYGAYWNVYSQEAGLRFAFEVFRQAKARLEAGRANIADFQQARGQYEQFRVARLNAINTALEGERQLRGLLNLPIEDGCRLMPSDSPTLAPYKPDWDTAAHEALVARPELHLARQEVKVAQMNVILAKNLLLPDLRFTSTWDTNAIGTRLDGPDANNALRNLSNGSFHNWAIGLRVVMPLGYRFQHVQVRQAQLALARAMEVLKQQEISELRFLAGQYRQLITRYELIRANRAQREAFGLQMAARYQDFLAGRGTLDILLESQRFWAAALAQEYNEIANYQIALAAWEYAKGTIMQHDNVVIAEGGLPQCAGVRAVEHQRERTASLVLRERAKVAGAACGPNGPPTMSLPGLLEVAPPLKEVPTAPPTHVPGDPLRAPVEGKPEELLPAPRPVGPDASKPAVLKGPSDFGALRNDRPAGPTTPALPPPPATPAVLPPLIGPPQPGPAPQ